ncbi:radical SAM protein [Desulfovibrio sp. JC010]|uniref:radical SAM protein n=1 Tax=Desulfovibrio sp. JC010 TaxID=2593641 RepID=UPI0013D63BB1|nr:radical SAM protein [Desulfovibrio sp. JC010]NDV27491.1 radical SAM protein [Desulfovibrio sp. JC010]
MSDSSFIPYQAVVNAFRHVGAGRNFNLLTMARNGLPAYLPMNGFAFSPLTIFLSVNSVCNLRCKMCDFGQKNEDSSFFHNLNPGGASASLDFDRLKDLLQEASSFRPKPRISVTTTEPFLYPRLFELARLTTDLGMDFQTTTNGLLLEKRIPEIMESGISELGVSIDAAGALHDEIRGLPGLFDRIINGLKLLHEAKKRAGTKFPTVTILTTISNFNYHALADLFAVLPQRLYDRAIISHMNFVSPASAEEHNTHFAGVGEAQVAGLPGDTDFLQVDVGMLHEQISRIKKTTPGAHFAPDFKLADLKCFYREPERFVWPTRCYIPWFVMEILADGGVIPMTRCIQLPLGNINEQGLAEIWNGPAYRKFRRQLKQHKRFPICRRCRGLL